MLSYIEPAKIISSCKTVRVKGKRKNISKSTDVRRSVYLNLVRPLFGYATQIWAPQSIKLITIKRTQRRATKYVLKLPFSCTNSYVDRLKSLDLLPLTFWQEYLDMVFFYFKIIHGLESVDPSIVPNARITRPTRSSSSGVIKFVEPKFQAATYQKSYITRCVRVWNVVADELILS